MRTRRICCDGWCVQRTIEFVMPSVISLGTTSSQDHSENEVVRNQSIVMHLLYLIFCLFCFTKIL